MKDKTLKIFFASICLIFLGSTLGTQAFAVQPPAPTDEQTRQPVATVPANPSQNPQGQAANPASSQPATQPVQPTLGGSSPLTFAAKAAANAAAQRARTRAQAQHAQTQQAAGQSQPQLRPERPSALRSSAGASRAITYYPFKYDASGRILVARQQLTTLRFPRECRVVRCCQEVVS